MIESDELEIFTGSGGQRRKANTIGVGDTIKLKSQRSFFSILFDPGKTPATKSHSIRTNHHRRIGEISERAARGPEATTVTGGPKNSSPAECLEDALIRMRRVRIVGEVRLILIRSRENHQQLGKW
jgi:hypothetical protein